MNNALRSIAKVTRMELKMTAANKAFVIMTILGPFILAAFAILPSVLMRSASEIQEGTTVAMVGGDETLFRAVNAAAATSPIDIIRGTDVDRMRQMVTDKEIAGFIRVPDDYLNAQTLEYYSRTGTDIGVGETVRAYIGSAIVSMRLQNEGLDAGVVSRLTARPQLQMNQVGKGDEEDVQQSFEKRIFTVIAFTLLLYMTVLLYGQATARSVLKEKNSKTVEIMLSSIRPSEMLFGKLFGQAFAAIIQYAVWAVFAVAIVSTIGPRLGVELQNAIPVSMFGYLIGFFILGFFLYSSAYAAIGSGAEDETHLGQLAWPLMVFLIAPMILSTSIMMNPDSGVAVFASFFPLTSPIVMFIRVYVGSPSPSAVALSVVILVATVIAVTAASAKIFRTGILMTGKRFSLGEIVRWIRY